MLTKILSYLFCREIRTKGREDITSPVETEYRCENGTTGKFDADVKAISAKWEFKKGTCINTTLQELLLIAPRSRARVDAYNSLVKFLKSNYGVTLIIKSRKQNGQKL